MKSKVCQLLGVGKVNCIVYMPPLDMLNAVYTPVCIVYVGSTTKPTDRWSTHKSHCNSKNSSSTGLSSHFRIGCPNDPGRDKTNLDVTLVDFYDTTETKLIKAGHVPGPKCRCRECENLKLKEDRWILNLGTLYNDGLNRRDEVKCKSRFNWK